VFEVGFSESYDDLVRDMRQWFLCYSGEVELVILVDIIEDRERLDQVRDDNRTKRRIP
jgi:hypothetical protein